MIRIQPEALIVFALLILVLPLKWLASAVTAAIVHESAHIAFLLLLGGRLHRITIGVGSAVIDGFLPNRYCELLCILAGPAGSLMLCFLCRRFPELAICGFVQGVFNLLPLYPLDGGRLLRCTLEYHFPKKREQIEYVVYLLLILAGLFLCILLGSFFEILLFIAFVFGLLRKSPCKQA